MSHGNPPKMPPMNATFRNALRLATAAALAAAAAAMPAVAQNGGLPADVVGAKQQLTAEQRKQVAQSVEQFAQRFADADPAGVVAVRNELVTLMRNPLTGIGFRRDFGADFVKEFRKFASGHDSMRASNAFIVARFVGTSEAVDFVCENLDPDAQQDIAVRIAAASQVTKAVDAAPLSPPQLDTIAKRLASVAKKETDWVVVSHEVDCITQMLHKEALPATQADAIAMNLAGTINDLTARVSDGSQPNLVNALQRALLAVRNQLSGVAASARTKLLAAIAPSLDSLGKLKGTPPKGISEGHLEGTFEAVVNTAGLLQKVRATGGTGV